MSLLRVNTIRSKDNTAAPTFDKGITVTGTAQVTDIQITSGILTTSVINSTAGNFSGILTASEVRANTGNFVGVVTALNFVNYSDITYKTNITPIVNALDTISRLNGVTFEWSETKEPSIGLIAQEVERVLPEVVTNFDGVKTVNYINIIAILIEAIKDLKQEIESLKNTK